MPSKVVYTTLYKLFSIFSICPGMTYNHFVYITGGDEILNRW